MDHMGNRTLILIDDSNIYYGFKSQKWKIDYSKFYKWLHDNFKPINIYFYAGIISKKAYFDLYPLKKITDFNFVKNKQKLFYKKLKMMGYIVINKPVASIYDQTTGSYKRKCNLDVEMTITAIDKINEYSELILCSGDGDFIKLLKYVKGMYKKTIVIAHKNRINDNLVITANQTIYFTDIKKEVEKRKGLP